MLKLKRIQPKLSPNRAEDLLRRAPLSHDLDPTMLNGFIQFLTRYVVITTNAEHFISSSEGSVTTVLLETLTFVSDPNWKVKSRTIEFLDHLIMKFNEVREKVFNDAVVMRKLAEPLSEARRSTTTSKTVQRDIGTMVEKYVKIFSEWEIKFSTKFIKLNSFILYLKNNLKIEIQNSREIQRIQMNRKLDQMNQIMRKVSKSFNELKDSLRLLVPDSLEDAFRDLIEPGGMTGTGHGMVGGSTVVNVQIRKFLGENDEIFEMINKNFNYLNNTLLRDLSLVVSMDPRQEMLQVREDARKLSESIHSSNEYKQCLLLLSSASGIIRPQDIVGSDKFASDSEDSSLYEWFS
jgi:hypothetical protein